MAIVVTTRDNNGQDAEATASSAETAAGLAKAARVAANHMVCIVVDGHRVERWDRDHAVGQNRWRAVDPDAFEIFGRLRTVIALTNDTDLR